MVLQQIFLDSKYADETLADGSQAHFLSDPIIRPEGNFFRAHVINFWCPLTYYNVFEGNNYLDISYALGGIQRNEFQPGNRDIDYMLSVINNLIQFDFVCEYDASTNKISFLQGTSILFIEESSTCLDLLGLEANQVGYGALTAKFGVDLTRTSSILIRTNLHGTNRDPVNKRSSDILCKVPVSYTQPNELIEYSQSTFIRITNPLLDHFVLQLVDDDGRYLDLNGARWTMTLQISLEKDEAHDPSITRFVSQPVSNDPVDESLGATEGEPADETQRG